MKPKIIVDVDLTVVDTLTPWLQWYEDLTGHKIQDTIMENNDFESLMHMHSDPLSFWKDPNLYQKVQPIQEAVQYIEKLRKDYLIIIVSDCFAEHRDSKKYFCEKYFKPHGFIDTKDKHFVQADFMIDDYKKYLLKTKEYQPNCKVFQHKTKINKPTPGIPRGTWKEFYEFVLSET